MGGSSPRAYHLKQRTRGGQGQDRGHPNPPSSKYRTRFEELSRARRLLPEIHSRLCKIFQATHHLLCKDKDLIIDEEEKHTFVMLQQALIKAPILQTLNWDLPFEIM